MTFFEDGFLSGDLQIYAKRNRSEYSAWFALIDAFNKDVTQTLPKIHVLTDNKQQFTSALLFSRAVQSFQAAILLAERGMIPESRTLVRNCAETAIVLAMVAKDANFVGKMVEAHQKHWLNFANALSENLNTMDVLLPPDKLKSLRQVKETIAQLYPDKSPGNYNLAEVADTVEMTALYNMVFRGTSGDAAHPTIGALMQHTFQNETGDIEDLRFEPTNTDLNVTLSGAVSSLWHTLESMHKVFAIPDFRKILGDYQAQLKAFDDAVVIS